MRPANRQFLTAASIVFAVLGASMWSLHRAAREKQAREQIRLRRAAEVSTRLTVEVGELLARGGGRLDLASVSRFEWERAFVFLPYSEASSIDSTLGFDWDEAWKYAPTGTDRDVLLVFTRAREVVHWQYVERRVVDFDDNLHVGRGDGRLTVFRCQGRAVISTGARPAGIYSHEACDPPPAGVSQ